mmetsp:Transcript_26866/g.37864  ORF Transcript_26866/g.37864 Transcript_26866/m.37864 type:complete len:343 (-) Transcript_26866:275-1303(-)
MKCKIPVIFTVSVIGLPKSCNSFTSVAACQRNSDRTRSTFGRDIVSSSTTTHCNLIPISQFSSDMTFLSSSEENRCNLDENGIFRVPSDNDDEDLLYELCIVEEKDLPDVSRFVIEAFGADAIALSGNLNNFERAFLEPAVNILNGYSGLVAYAEVYSGILSRTKDRHEVVDISPPSLEGMSRQEKLSKAAKTSIILALARRVPASDWRIEVIGSVELRLQPCDAKIPFSLPWLDKLERKIAEVLKIGSADRARDLQPYLSNLCIDEKFRGQKLGKSLVRCVEDIATTTWGYSKLFLHVDLENVPALNLYKGEEYFDVKIRWNPFWAGRAADIGYFVKKFAK